MSHVCAYQVLRLLLQGPFEAFKLDVKDLFLQKLSKYPAQSYWRTNSPTHFGGATGTFTAVEEVPRQLHPLYTAAIAIHALLLSMLACMPAWSKAMLLAWSPSI